MDENYEPFGAAWKAEVMKMRKEEIIDHLAGTLKLLKIMETQLTELNEEQRSKIEGSSRGN